MMIEKIIGRRQMPNATHEFCLMCVGRGKVEVRARSRVASAAFAIMFESKSFSSSTLLKGCRMVDLQSEPGGILVKTENDEDLKKEYEGPCTKTSSPPSLCR